MRKTKTKAWEVDQNIVLMPVCNGTIKRIMNDRINGRFSDIYVLDIGPEFNNPQETYDIIDRYSSANQNITWVDHHFDNWGEEARCKYNNSKNLILMNTKSCAEIVKHMSFEKLSRNLVCFGTDADGLISAALLCANRYLRESQKDRLIDIAIKCDTASFYGDSLATNVHKAVYIARLKGTSIQLLELLVNMAASNFNKSRYYNEFMKIVDLYDMTVASMNKLITKGHDVMLMDDVNNDKTIVFNSENICNADLTYIFSKCYKFGYKIIMVENATFIRVASNSYDLKNAFNLTRGMKYKIQLPKSDWPLEKVYNICKGMVE